MYLKDKVCVVIGGARGIGRAYVEELLERGAKVVIGDINNEVAEATVKELGEKFNDKHVLYRRCDIIKEEDIKGLFEFATSTFGPVEVFANSSGALNEFDWKTTVDVNYGGVIRATTIAMEYMGKQKGGKAGVIVHTSSRAGLLGGEYSPVYAGTKAAVIWYCRSFAMEPHYQQHGIRVNVVAPCVVDTEFRKNACEGQIYFADAVATRATLGMVTPVQCAEAFIKLVEDDKMNGHVMVCSSQKGNFLDPQNMDYAKLS